MTTERAIKRKDDSKFVGDSGLCPRCRSETKQHYGNFIYATQVAPRVMFVPAGYFCKKCPTVIIDQDMIREGVAKRFDYRGVLGISNDSRKDEPDFFKTWNGQKAVYIFDENHEVMEIEVMVVVRSL